MEQRIVIELIRTLTEDEKNIVMQFASIPFFNNGKYRASVPGFLKQVFNWTKEGSGFPDKNTIELL